MLVAQATPSKLLRRVWRRRFFHPLRLAPVVFDDAFNAFVDRAALRLVQPYAVYDDAACTL
jgi:hypothetical protein